MTVYSLTADQRTLVGALTVSLKLKWLGRLATPTEAELLREAIAILNRDLLERQRKANLESLLDELGTLPVGRAVPGGSPEPVRRAAGPAGGSGMPSGRPNRRDGQR